MGLYINKLRNALDGGGRGGVSAYFFIIVKKSVRKVLDIFLFKCSNELIQCNQGNIVRDREQKLMIKNGNYFVVNGFLTFKSAVSL